MGSAAFRAPFGRTGEQVVRGGPPAQQAAERSRRSGAESLHAFLFAGADPNALLRRIVAIQRSDPDIAVIDLDHAGVALAVGIEVVIDEDAAVVVESVIEQQRRMQAPLSAFGADSFQNPRPSTCGVRRVLGNDVAEKLGNS